VEGLDARQLGNIYHHILEKVYLAAQGPDPTAVQPLLDALPQAAAAVLDAAPEQEGFRATAWWAHTREEIIDHVRRSLQALAELAGEFVPWGHEVCFGVQDQPPLTVYRGSDHFHLRGFIDRVDRASDGRVRIIDYKTGGPWGFTSKAVSEGHKLQLSLYALAARDALGLGDPADGFYWHVRHAQPSSFTLGTFDGGPRAAMRTAVEKAWEAVQGTRDGHFSPDPPGEGCPDYCPAAGFCWRLRPRFGG